MSTLSVGTWTPVEETAEVSSKVIVGNGNVLAASWRWFPILSDYDEKGSRNSYVASAAWLAPPEASLAVLID